MYVITRQSYWPNGVLMVEIAKGGIDYCNPDALVQKYEGEFEEFHDPREAATCALKILKLWRKDSPNDKIGIAYGSTCRMTIPFEPVSISEINKWALQEYENLPKCDQCGEIVGDTVYGLIEDDELKFCSESCAQKRCTQLSEEDNGNKEGN